jgi:Uma2 family endonuclease
MLKTLVLFKGASDMKVKVEAEIFYYPDVVVACQEIINNYCEANPCVIVEVISKATACNDLLEKRLAYIKLESLQLYLLVDSCKRWVRGYKRAGSQWQEISVAKIRLLTFPVWEQALAKKKFMMEQI